MAEEISPLENHGWWMERLRKDAKANRPEAEPVGEVYRYGKDSHGRQWHGIHWYDPNVDVPTGTKLYTHPPRREWRSLSEEEIKNAVGASAEFWATSALWIKSVARAIEAALRSKNHE